MLVHYRQASGSRSLQSSRGCAPPRLVDPEQADRSSVQFLGRHPKRSREGVTKAHGSRRIDPLLLTCEPIVGPGNYRRPASVLQGPTPRCPRGKSSRPAIQQSGRRKVLWAMPVAPRTQRTDQVLDCSPDPCNPPPFSRGVVRIAFPPVMPRQVKRRAAGILCRHGRRLPGVKDIPGGVVHPSSPASQVLAEFPRTEDATLCPARSLVRRIGTSRSVLRTGE